MLRIAATSDLHGQLPELIPQCDVLLIGGDICPVYDHAVSFQAAWLDTVFRRWLDKLTCKVIATWGNHDFIGQQRPDLVPNLPWTLLVDEAYEYKGLKFYGSPWQLPFYDWAFNMPESEIYKKWQAIPDDTDVLVLHGPPLGCGDRVGTRNTGSPSLRGRIHELKPKLTIFGHIHCGYGLQQRNGIMMANVAAVNEGYQHIHAPMLFDVEDFAVPVLGSMWLT